MPFKVKRFEVPGMPKIEKFPPPPPVSALSVFMIAPGAVWAM